MNKDFLEWYDKKHPIDSKWNNVYSISRNEHKYISCVAWMAAKATRAE